MNVPMRTACRQVGDWIASASTYRRKRDAIQTETGSSKAIKVKSSQP